MAAPHLGRSSTAVQAWQALCQGGHTRSPPVTALGRPQPVTCILPVGSFIAQMAHSLSPHISVPDTRETFAYAEVSPFIEMPFYYSPI